jgi:hypothetical protein
MALVFGRFTTTNGKPVEKLKVDVRSIFSYLYFLKEIGIICPYKTNKPLPENRGHVITR